MPLEYVCACPSSLAFPAILVTTAPGTVILRITLLTSRRYKLPVDGSIDNNAQDPADSKMVL
jgi:hypothetical protein